VYSVEGSSPKPSTKQPKGIDDDDSDDEYDESDELNLITHLQSTQEKTDNEMMK